MEIKDEEKISQEELDNIVGGGGCGSKIKFPVDTKVKFYNVYINGIYVNGTGKVYRNDCNNEGYVIFNAVSFDKPITINGELVDGALITDNHLEEI